MTVDGINTGAHSALVRSPLAFSRSVSLSDRVTDITLGPDNHLTLHLQAQLLSDLDLGAKGEQLIELLLLLLVLLPLKAGEIITMAAGRNQNWLWPGASEQVWAAGAALKKWGVDEKRRPLPCFCLPWLFFLLNRKLVSTPTTELYFLHTLSFLTYSFINVIGLLFTVDTSVPWNFWGFVL